ncbi:MAG: hypothetical protein BWY57_03211 [Betaproteobacteria bacterium ADurb.Bin341]|nr:MAG: hypothetical protein BWY57_03211 [Betaproteobacteria bacterium ADurb.Bin341]
METLPLEWIRATRFCESTTQSIVFNDLRKNNEIWGKDGAVEDTQQETKSSPN